jgi:phage terminase small subunit
MPAKTRTTTRQPVPVEGADKPLTYMQAAFVEEYVKTWNASEAARRVGAAVVSGTNWLDATKFPQVTAAIRARMADTLVENKAEAKKVVGELLRVGLFNPKEMCHPDGRVKTLLEMPDHVAAAIKKMSVSYEESEDPDGNPVRVRKVSVEFHDKMWALEMLMKHLGLFDEKTGVNNQQQLGVDWGRLMTPVLDDEPDPVEERLDRERKALPAHQPGKNGGQNGQG